MKTIKQIVFVLAIAVMVQACKPAGGEFPGTEYMPDMAHPHFLRGQCLRRL